jgi:hypothetical protein
MKLQILLILTVNLNKVDALYARHVGDINVKNMAWCFQCVPNPKAPTVSRLPLEMGPVSVEAI